MIPKTSKAKQLTALFNLQGGNLFKGPGSGIDTKHEQAPQII